MIRRARYLSILPFALLAANDARAKDLEPFHAYAQETPVAGVSKPAGARGFVASTDDKRGTPTFFWAQRNQPLPASLVGANQERIARHHLNAHADMYGLTPKALQTARQVMVHDNGHGGVIIVFRQYLDGVEVLNSDMKVLMDRQGKLVALGGALHPDAMAGSAKKWGAFSLASDAAVGKSLEDLYGVKLSSSSFQAAKTQKAGYDVFTLKAPFKVGSSSHAFAEPARAKKVYFPMPQGLVPAYYVEVQVSAAGGTTPDAYGYVIAANDGRLLRRVSLTEYDVYQYRVWADTSAPYTPKDGPLNDYTPHPAGMPDNTIPAFAAPSLISMEGFNTNPQGMADPWLPAGATETKGNNIDAYTDHTDCSPPAAGQPATACTAAVAAANNGFTVGVDLRGTVTAPGVFDRTYDPAISPIATPAQSMAATTQLFYTTNWLHDYWYDSGFNEAAGNAQESNLGRGGVEGDVLQAQAQDKALGLTGGVGAARNNANMNTPADGTSPRMQMFLWSGQNDVNLDIGAPINASYAAGTGAFGPQNFDITADLVLGDDNTIEPIIVPSQPVLGTLNDGCSPLVGNYTGKIVLVERGYCAFTIKATNVQASGAVGMIVANNTGTAVISMGGTDPGNLTIGSLSTTLANGNALKAALLNGPIPVHMKRVSGVEHDGTIDNSIIAHEWGHYIHNRLVSTGTNQARSQGEGWGDFVALHMGSHEGDNFATGTFAAAQYSTVSFTDEGYYGIRRLPYTRDMTKNPFTFKHIADENALPVIPMGSGGAVNSEVHNAGEIWTSMMWDAYTALILSNKYTFDQTKRKMADYVVGGMMMAPIGPTFTEQRDGILAYVAASDNADMLLLAGEFARRGLGSCAISPERFSTNHNGAVESYDVKGNQAILSAKADDSILSCDSDGILDGGETGKVNIEVANNGPIALTNTMITVTTANPGIVFPNGNTAMVTSLAGFAKTTASIEISLAPGQYANKRLDLSISADNAAGCAANVQLAASDRIDIDDLVGISTVDTVTSEKSTWKITGAGSSDIWSRAKDANANFRWVGLDSASNTDTALESADIKVAANGNFIVSFEHRFKFETGNGQNFDGGVIEVSSDAGATWQDVSTYGTVGYNGAITTTSDNPIGGRMAFINQSAGYPAMTSAVLNLGSALAGKTVRLRFRIATDTGTSAAGWEIDNIGLLFVDNKPFSDVVDDAGVCNGVPTADAGADQSVIEGNLVQLDGTGSADPDGDALKYTWTQMTGPTATLFAGATATPAFVAPDVTDPTILTFQLLVSDTKGSAGDTVDVVVMPDPSQGTGGGGVGGMGSGGMGAGGAGGGGVGGAAGAAGAGGEAGTGGTGGGMGGMGGVGGEGGVGGNAGAGEGGGSVSSSSSSSSTGSSSSSSSGEGGSGGGTTTPSSCDCAIAGDTSGPVRPGMLGGLGLLLGMLLRRNRRSTRN